MVNWSVNLTGFHAGCGVPCVSRGQLVWFRAYVVSRPISNSAGVGMPSDGCRRCRLREIQGARRSCWTAPHAFSSAAG